MIFTHEKKIIGVCFLFVSVLFIRLNAQSDEFEIDVSILQQLDSVLSMDASRYDLAVFKNGLLEYVNQTPRLRGELDINSYLNPNLFIEDINTVYTDYRASLNTAVLDIPFALTLNLALENNKMNRSRSGIQFNFDANHLAQNLRDRYIDLEVIQHQKLSQITPSVDELLSYQENILYQSYQNLTTSLDWQNLKNRISLNIDKPSSPEIDSLINLVEKVEQRYTELWKKKLVTPDSLRLVFDSKVTRLRQHYNKLNEPNYIKEFLPIDSLKTLEKIMLHTQKLNIGLFTLSEDELLIRHRLLKGGEYAVDNEKWSLHLAHGREHLQQYLQPNIVNFQFNPYQISYGKINRKEREDFEYYFAALNAKKKNYNDNRWNRVLSVGGKQNIGSYQSLSLDVAYGQSSDLQTEQDIDKDPIAIHLKWNLRSKNENINTSLGYFRVGTDYESVGNPFLFTNREGISLSLEGRFFKDRLDVNLETKYGTSINKEKKGLINWQLFGNLNYAISDNSSFGISYLPNIYQETDIIRAEKKQQNLYIIYAQIYNNINDYQWVNTANYSNRRSGFSQLDSLEIGVSKYLNIQSNLIASNNNSLNLIINTEMIEKGDFLIQLDYQWTKDHFQIGGGGQYFNTFQNSGQGRYGVLGQLGINKPKFSLSINSIYWIDNHWSGHLNITTRI